MEFNAIGSGNWEGINFNRRSFQISYVLQDIRSDIYFEIVGPTAFLSVGTDGFREVCRLIETDLLKTGFLFEFSSFPCTFDRCLEPVLMIQQSYNGRDAVF